MGKIRKLFLSKDGKGFNKSQAVAFIALLMFALLFLFSLVYILAGLSGGKLSDNNKILARQMVKAADAYLDGDVSANSAWDAVNSLEGRILDSSDIHNFSETDFKRYSLELMISLTSQDASGVLTARNNIAKLAGVSKRWKV